MQDIDKSMVKAIAEEFQVSKTVALRILEAREWRARAVNGWTLSASEAQGTGHKCGEGACKAKEEAQTPVPVRKPAAPKAVPKTAAEIWLGKVAKSVRAMELEASPMATDEIWVGSQNRATIPLRIIELAEGINGMLKSKRHKFGALTVIKGNCKVTVLFGDKSAKHKGARVVHLNCKGQAQFRVSSVFTDGDPVKCLLLKDGSIVLRER